jgi:hypothetical protein
MLGQVISVYRDIYHTVHNPRASTETDVHGNCTMVIFISSILGQKFVFTEFVYEIACTTDRVGVAVKFLTLYSGSLLFESWPRFFVASLSLCRQILGWYLDLAAIPTFQMLSKSK